MVTKNDILNVKKGVVRKITIKSDSGILKKGKENGLEKITTFYGRFGVDYANMKSTKEYLQANGLTQPNGLPWGNWIQAPYFINHKDVVYVRISSVNLPNLKPQTKYIMGGVEYDRQYLIDNKFISASTHDNPSVISVKLDNIIKIHNVAE